MDKSKLNRSQSALGTDKSTLSDSSKNRTELETIQFDATFTATVDKLIMLADKDKHLSESIKCADDESKESGMSFYEVFYNLMAILHSIDQETKECLDNGSRAFQYLP